jgi:integrase
VRPRKVASVKKGLHAVATNAPLQHVSPQMLRHSAAVHMAEAGISMEEIAQFLGHSSVEVTRKVHARFSPTYLRKAASVLEYDDLGSMNQGELPKPHVSA